MVQLVGEGVGMWSACVSRVSVLLDLMVFSLAEGFFEEEELAPFKRWCEPPRGPRPEAKRRGIFSQAMHAKLR